MRSLVSLGLMCLVLVTGDDKGKTAAQVRPARRPKPIARVYAPNGGVILSPADSNAKAEPRASKPSESLRVGDRVEVKETGAATIVYFSGKRFRIKPGRSVTLKTDGPEPTEAVEALEDISKNVVSPIKGLPFDERYGGAIIRGGIEHPPAVTPIDGALIESDSPSLEWPERTGAKTYRVRVFSAADNDSKHPLLSADVSAVRLEWPQTAKPLSRGDVFVWTVHAVAGAVETPVCSARFTVSSAETAAALAAARPLLKSDDPADLLLAADTFRSVSADDLSRAAFSRLVSLFPDNADYRSLLSEYNRLAGLKAAK